MAHDRETVEAQRARRRDIEERRLRGVRGPGENTGGALDILGLPEIADPPQYLEDRRAQLIQALIKDASETDDPELRARICVNLLKFSSMGRSHVDLQHSLKRDELPDLSKLFSEDELRRISMAPQGELESMVLRLGGGQRSAESTGESEDV